jgi:hypothetical protein
MADLASTYGNQGRRKEAKELELQVMETRKQMFETQHPDMRRSIRGRAENPVCSNVIGLNQANTRVLLS